MLKQFLQLPLATKAALLTALLCLASGIILALISQQGSRQLIQQSADLFGESMVKQLSRDASTPLVQGDKLSLQSLLEELVNSPMVARGAIYDVANRPVAEAGQPSHGLSHSASITFQDSIAGYAVIVFDTQILQRQANSSAWQLVALALLLAGLVYIISLLPARLLSATLNDLSQLALMPRQQQQPKTPAIQAKIAYPGKDELQQLAQDIINGPATAMPTPPIKTHNDGHPSAILLLELTNLPALQEQLPEQQLTALINHLQLQLKSLCKLYDGDITLVRSNSFCARFYFSEDENDYPFRALCCGSLIMQWAATQHSLPVMRIGLTLQQHLQQPEQQKPGSTINTEWLKQQAIESSLQQLQGIEAGLLASNTLLQHPSVRDRVDSSAINENSALINHLKEPYRALLTQQLLSLHGQIASINIDSP